MDRIDGDYFVICTTQRYTSNHVRKRHGKFLRKDLLPISATFDISLKNPKNRLSHPIVTPLMLVTTYYHPRSPPHPDEFHEIEGPWPQDGPPGGIGEDGDHDDLMGGSQAGLYSSDEGEQYSVVAWSRI